MYRIVVLAAFFHFLLPAGMLNAQSFGDQRIGGTITIAQDLYPDYNDQGTLFIMVYRYEDAKLSHPLAAVRIERPKYPQAFAIGPRESTVPGTPLVGPLRIMARHSLRSTAYDLQEDVLQGGTQSGAKIEVGQRDIQIQLK